MKFSFQPPTGLQFGANGTPMGMGPSGAIHPQGAARVSPVAHFVGPRMPSTPPVVPSPTAATKPAISKQAHNVGPGGYPHPGAIVEDGWN